MTNDERTGRHAKITHVGERWYYTVYATRGNLPDEAVDTAEEPGYADAGGAIAALHREHPGVDYTVENDT